MYVFKSLASHDSTELLHRPDSRDGFSVVSLAFCLHGNSNENTFCPTAQIAVITTPDRAIIRRAINAQVSICYSTYQSTLATCDQPFKAEYGTCVSMHVSLRKASEGLCNKAFVLLLATSMLGSAMKYQNA